MKRLMTSVMCSVLLVGASLPEAAQTRRDRRYDRSTSGSRYDSRSIWNKSRDKITTAGGALGGAAIGGAIGGGKGAVIGAILGGGGGALYTYKIRKNQRRYNRRY